MSPQTKKIRDRSASQPQHTGEVIIPTVASRIIEGCVFLILFLPLLAVPYFAFPTVFPKVVVFRTLVEIMAGVFLYLMIAERRSIKISWLTVAVLLFLGVLTVTAFFGLGFSRSFWGTMNRSEGLIQLYHLGAFFLIVSSVFSRRHLVVFAKAALAVAAVVALSAIGQYLVNPDRVTATLGNAAFLASYLVFPFFFSVYFFCSEARRGLRVLYGATALASLLALLFTGTRGALLGVVAGIFLLLLFAAARRLPLAGLSSRVVQATALGALVILVAVAATLFFARQKSFVERVPVFARLSDISLETTTAQTRFIVWRASIEAWKEKPWFGWGLEHFDVAFNAHFDPEILTYGEQHFDRAHNQILNYAVDSGAAGVAAYFLVWCAVFVTLLRIRKRDPAQAALVAVLGAAGVAYLAQNLFVFDSAVPAMMWFFFLAVLATFSPPLKAISFPAAKNAVLDSPRKAMLLLCALGLLFLWYGGSMKPALASWYGAKGNALEQEDPARAFALYKKAIGYHTYLSLELEQTAADFITKFIEQQGGKISDELREDAAFAEKALTRQISEMPSIRPFASYLMLAQLYRVLARSDPSYNEKALEVLEQGIVATPRRPHLYREIGRVKAQQGERKEALWYFEKAVLLNDKVASSHWDLALASILAGDVDRGEAEADKAFALGYPFTAENLVALADAFVELRKTTGEDYIDIMVNLYEQAVEIEPENSQLFASLAAAYKERGDIAKAEEAAQRVAQLDPNLQSEVDSFLESLRVRPFAQ